VRSIYAAWERGDFSSVEWVHPEIEFVRLDGPHPDRSKGPTGMAKSWRGFLSAWEEFRTEADEYREIGRYSSRSVEECRDSPPVVCGDNPRSA
jgi:hypothetical protein